MRSIGLVLITIGSLAGALVAVLDPAAIRWAWFVPCLAIGVIGVTLVQIGIRRHATDAARLESNTQILGESLHKIVDALTQLDDTKEQVDTYALPDRIDQTFREDIGHFVDARESIVHIWGVQSYADVMSHFAAGERYLNRVWSSAADGYIDEAHAYIGRSRDQFAEALQKFEALGERKPERKPQSA